MTRSAYDSTNANDIPTTAKMVGGYVDGKFKWTPANWQRFPNAIHVPIACFPATNDGVVGDVETGDMLPWELPDWVLRRRIAGVDPTGYVNRSNLNATRTEFQLRNIREPHWWLSTLDGSQPWLPGVVAIQAYGSTLSGGHYDLSVVADFWPGVDQQGENIMDVDTRNTFKKTTLNDFANAYRLTLTDAELDGYMVKLADDFHNVRAIQAEMLAEHPPVAPHAPGTTIKLEGTLS